MPRATSAIGPTYSAWLLLLSVVALMGLGVLLGLTGYVVSVVRTMPVLLRAISSSSSSSDANVTCNASFPLVLDTMGECDDARDCTVDLVDPDLHYCQNAPASTQVACTSAAACYDATTVGTLHCDGKGGCVGTNASACNGFCPYGVGGVGGILSIPDICSSTNYCTPDKFPLKPYFYAPVNADPLDNMLNAGFFDPYAYSADLGFCYAQVCLLSVIQLRAYTVTLSDFGTAMQFPLFGSISRCEDMLDTESTVVDTSCIVATEIPVDSTFLNDYVTAAISFGHDGPVSALNYTGRMCMFRYACAQFNESVFYDPANLDPAGPIQMSTLMSALNTSDILQRAWNHSIYAAPPPLPGTKRAVANIAASHSLAHSVLAATLSRFDAAIMRRKKRSPGPRQSC